MTAHPPAPEDGLDLTPPPPGEPPPAADDADATEGARPEAGGGPEGRPAGPAPGARPEGAEAAPGMPEELRELLAFTAQRLGEDMRAHREDFARWSHGQRRALRRAAIALCAAAPPALLAVGVLLQAWVGLVEARDQADRWRDWVWENHGTAVRECAAEAQRTGRAVACTVTVRVR